MYEKKYPSQDHNPKPKGHHLPHYQGSELPSAMKYPDTGDVLPDSLPDLASMQPMERLIPSSPEAVLLIQAFNEAPGSLPESPNGMLLENLAGPDFNGHQTPLTSIGTQDEKSNGIVYLRHDKFVHAGELKDYVNGRDTPKNGRRSKEIINKYRSMSYKTMPPIQHVIAYYEEQSGNTYYSLVGNGTHRLAARRGDEYVPAVSVSFVRLDTDAISARLEQISTQEEQTKRRFGDNILKRLGIHKSLDQ